MKQNAFLLYGANGYSGKLIARFAGQYNLQPILAGRNREAVAALANELQLSYQVADLTDARSLAAIVSEVKLVVHAAGPYDVTARPMIDACLAAGTHYIDLNGDLEVFEMIQGYDTAAKEKSCMLLPGAGFDVVPTDCLARWLKNRLPDADRLEIAFVIVGSGLSRGTSITTLQRLGLPGARRENGKIVAEPIGVRGKWVSFPPGKEKSFVMSIPWGDVSTAYFSTGIPNIQTYTGIGKSVWIFLKAQRFYNWLLRTPLLHRLIKAIINSKSPGPGDERRDKAVSLIRAKVSNPAGTVMEASMRCPEAYSLTAMSVLLIAQKILAGEWKAGYQTPASAYGADLIMEIPGVERYAL